MANHHRHTGTVSTVIRSATPTACRHDTARCHAACKSHSRGAGTIIASAVAFTAPTVKTINAIAAGSPHLPGLASEFAVSAALRRSPAWLVLQVPTRLVARTVKATIQPRPAHGSSITDVRDTYGSTYGLSW